MMLAFSTWKILNTHKSKRIGMFYFFICGCKSPLFAHATISGCIDTGGRGGLEYGIWIQIKMMH